MTTSLWIAFAGMLIIFLISINILVYREVKRHKPTGKISLTAEYTTKIFDNDEISAGSVIKIAKESDFKSKC